MIEFLQRYSLTDILIFTVFLVLAIKGLVSFFDWLQERIKRVFNKEHSKLNEKEELQRRLQLGSQIMDSLQSSQETTDMILQDLSAKIDMLIDSDMDSIKSYITEKHHFFCYELGWIDDFSLDCIEKRFDHYEDEGGNSFVGSLMAELRALPKQPPQDD